MRVFCCHLKDLSHRFVRRRCAIQITHYIGPVSFVVILTWWSLLPHSPHLIRRLRSFSSWSVRSPVLEFEWCRRSGQHDIRGLIEQRPHPDITTLWDATCVVDLKPARFIDEDSGHPDIDTEECEKLPFWHIERLAGQIDRPACFHDGAARVDW